MKKVILAFLVVLLFLAGCASDAPEEKAMTPEEAEKEEFIDWFIELNEDPDAAVEKCDDFSEETRQTCYGTYLSLKAEREEAPDPEVCDKITDEEVQEGCKLMAYALK